MKGDSDVPLFEEILRESKLDRDPSFRERFTFTSNGFRFEQRLSKGGCLMGLFLGMIVPFLLWVYPGGAHLPLQITVVLVAAAIAGWYMLLVDLTRKVVLAVEKHALHVEWGWLGIRRACTLKPWKGDLRIYRQMQSAAGLMSVYGIKDAESGRDLKVSGSQRECRVLVAMIERTVGTERV